MICTWKFTRPRVVFTAPFSLGQRKRCVTMQQGKGDMETFWLDADTSPANGKQPSHWRMPRAHFLRIGAGGPFLDIDDAARIRARPTRSGISASSGHYHT